MDSYAPPPLWSYAPFVLLLLCIAILPLVHRLGHFWEKNSNKLLVSLFLASLTLLYYAFIHPGLKPHPGEVPPGTEGQLIRGGDAVLQVLQHSVVADYIPFIILLFSLYTISGGILLTGDIPATPLTNCAFLASGALLSSFIGTTGASMLLIRPLLRTNSERRIKVHTVVFFIFIVSNVGGSLTPLGDPPLFLGYLRGVPFWWTLHLAPPMAFLIACLLAIYFFWDTVAYRKEAVRDIALDEMSVRPIAVLGKINFVWLIGVIACVALVDSSRPLPGTSWTPPEHGREALLLALTGISWFTTPRNREIRSANAFNFTAIGEVACLFIGIFICMQTPIEYLHEAGPRLRLQTPSGFYWASGGLSSFLDNAPTYVVFFEAAKSMSASFISQGLLEASHTVPLGDGLISAKLLLAVSMGSVFMGANTYIGNGPNFMVKTIAEQSGIKMPSFFGYMVYSMCILIPLFVAVMIIFLR
jgi:Na+/H+ antiporter NhaD/arsenite permease-like protein